jgi:hypothetical protein
MRVDLLLHLGEPLLDQRLQSAGLRLFPLPADLFVVIEAAKEAGLKFGGVGSQIPLK